MTLYPGVALVTGAASGIGRATAVSFAHEGCLRIVICDQNPAGLDETRKLIAATNASADVLVQKVDVIQSSEITEAITSAVAKFGRLDYAINCAGIGNIAKRSTELAEDEFEKIFQINYRGCWLSSRAELKQMLQQEPLSTHDGRPGVRGAVVNIASQLGLVGRPTAPAYCSAKSAVIAMTRCDAIDYSKDNIRVNCICPGLIDTPMTHRDPEKLKAMTASLAIAPMDRWGTAQEVADACLFLCSSKASFIQGAALVVDGGYTIN
ncbi:hypothetical protein BP6252_08295 [Coleophoma cylindrospora]|uniref:Uncharacterized protein n=1 Tax=Coleophoma cylindrospora TaxID=1849047 RepID=A0A3D8R5E8_9HELO|nr:hypothetical protein BP6252_08295 [Coleophoma cylindrospora]